MAENRNMDKELKALLGTYSVPPPDSALIGRVLKSGQQHVSFRRRMSRWVMGAGLVGLGLAGGVNGAGNGGVVLPSQTFVRFGF